MAEYSDGSTTYVYTHQAETAKDVLDMLHPHLGKQVTAYLDNGYGYIKATRITLAAVGGTDVAFWFNNQRYIRNGLEFTHKPVHVHQG